jgi:hypothetical protein
LISIKNTRTINSIGIDFDNTIICYDDVFCNLAFNKGWIDKDIGLSKNEIRDFIHEGDNGVEKWKFLQSMVYSNLISIAPPMPEVFKFIRICNAYNIPVYIVSHKTEYAEIDTNGGSLRKKALDWIRIHKVKYGVHLPSDNIYFTDTREEKIKLIEKLKFNYFIDDLKEVLCHPFFPISVRKVLINSNKDKYKGNKNCILVEKKNWSDIKDYVFGK